jgi:hypothetical protein
MASRTSEARREVKSLSRGEDTQGGSGAVFPSGTARENVTPRSSNLKIASLNDHRFERHPKDGKRNLGMEATIKSLMSSFEARAVPDRRCGKRRSSPRLAVYYWDGGTPKPHAIRDISLSGVYLLTQEPLFPGAMLLLTMQRDDLDESAPDQWIAVHALVIRRDTTGVALSFVFPRTRDSRVWASNLGNGATREEMTRFISKLFVNDDCGLQAKAIAPAVHAAQTEPFSAEIECSQAGRTVRPSKVCICNLTRRSMISLDMSVVDTVVEPLKTLVDDLSHVPSSGFWLTPFRGLPLTNGLERFDVIFLDDNYKIAECAEHFAVAESGSFRGEHASALVVPSRTISLSHVGVGDQLRICSPDLRASALTDPSCSIASTTEAEPDKSRQLGCLRDAAPPPSQRAVAPAGNGLRLPTETGGASSLDWNHPAMKTRFLRWLFPNIKPPDRRRAPRIPTPELIAFHWAGGEPKAHKLGDVSSSGFYLLTNERWLPGTRIAMTLQKSSCGGEDLTDWSRVESEVVRWGTDGVGFEFVEMNSAEILQGNELEKRAFEQFLEGVTASGGQGRTLSTNR